MKIKISEIFYSLQGELPGLGIPSIFVRFYGCNLKCKWCDTKYSFEGEEYKDMSLKEIINEIKKYKCKNVVITGGEPTFQYDNLISLMDILFDLNYNITVETNGTTPILFHFKGHINYVVSPKTISYSYSDSINYFKKCFSKFKIVHVSDDFVENIIEFYDLPKDMIIIMPFGASKVELEENQIKTFDFCKENELRMGYRLQISLFDKKRGV